MQYWRLLLIEQFFWAMKPVLQTRPVFHKSGATIRGRLLLVSGPDAVG